VRRPQLLITDVRGKKPIIEAIHREKRPSRWYIKRKASRIDSDRNIARDARGSTRVADPAHLQVAKRRVVWSYEVTFRRVGIVIINTTRAVGPSAAANQVAKRSYNDGSAAQNRTLLNNESCGVVKIPARRIEHVATDVESVGVDAERIVVEQLISIGAAYGVLLNEKERPICALCNDAVTGGIRYGNQHAVWNVGVSICVGAGNINHLQKPTFR